METYFYVDVKHFRHVFAHSARDEHSACDSRSRARDANAEVSVNKSELVDNVAGKADMPKAQVEKVLDGLITTVMDEVKRGEKVTIPGFGAWSRTQRAALTGRNPRTGEAVQIPASKAAKFTVGAKFKEHVKKS